MSEPIQQEVRCDVAPRALYEALLWSQHISGLAGEHSEQGRPKTYF